MLQTFVRGRQPSFLKSLLVEVWTSSKPAAAATMTPRAKKRFPSAASSFSTNSFDDNGLLVSRTPPSRDEIFARYPVTPGLGLVREAWLETLEDATRDCRMDEVVPLHPSIWSVRPRIDVIKENVDWQKTYKKVSYMHAKKVCEMPGGRGGRPWPQKGTGRARHRSIRSPLWVNGAKAHGPQNPRSSYYMLAHHIRLNGLIHTLAVKFAQDDVHIVRDLEIPTADPKFMEDLIDQRSWGLSTLLVDSNDIMPENITEATDKIFHVNLMPAYGLNVHSMLKHKTLVLTLSALNHIEDKLLFAINRLDKIQCNENHHRPASATSNFPKVA